VSPSFSIVGWSIGSRFGILVRLASFAVRHNGPALPIHHDLVARGAG
jgi:hypothetical protein